MYFLVNDLYFFSGSFFFFPEWQNGQYCPQGDTELEGDASDPGYDSRNILFVVSKKDFWLILVSRPCESALPYQ